MVEADPRREAMIVEHGPDVTATLAFPTKIL
jgi:hypothetical protein